jgi:hypothetical protein
MEKQRKQNDPEKLYNFVVHPFFIWIHLDTHTLILNSIEYNIRSAVVREVLHDARSKPSGHVSCDFYARNGATCDGLVRAFRDFFGYFFA